MAIAQTAAAQTGPYSDVPENAYYTTPVTALKEQGVFTDTLCAEGFCPGETMDRKTMAVWVVRVLDGEDPPAVSQTRFNDVDADSFHAPFIERMFELEVTRGCDDGSGFCPHRNVTRAQMAAFVSRAYGLPDGPDPDFSDVPADAWYAADVAKLAASGITVGCGDGSGFCPSQTTTRAQMAIVLWRAENTTTDTFVAVSAGRDHSCGLRTDQTLKCWGDNSSGQSDAPAGTFTAVSAGGGFRYVNESFTCGLKTDGAITCWGTNAPTPTGTFTVMSAGTNHLCGLRAADTIECWGDNQNGQSNAPAGTFTALSAGDKHSCALKTDATIRCWGDNRWRQLDAPTGTFTALSAGDKHSCALRTDGAVTCWGTNAYGQSDAPAGTFTALSAGVGLGHSCALRTDGAVIMLGHQRLRPVGRARRDLHRPVSRRRSLVRGSRPAAPSNAGAPTSTGSRLRPGGSSLRCPQASVIGAG